MSQSHAEMQASKVKTQKKRWKTRSEIRKEKHKVHLTQRLGPVLPQDQSTLLTTPGEIRNQIYSYLFPRRGLPPSYDFQGIAEEGYDYDPECNHWPECLDALNLLLACRQTYLECAPLALSRAISIPFEDDLRARDESIRALRPIAAFVKSIELQIPRWLYGPLRWEDRVARRLKQCHGLCIETIWLRQPGQRLEADHVAGPIWALARGVPSVKRIVLPAFIDPRRDEMRLGWIFREVRARVGKVRAGKSKSARKWSVSKVAGQTHAFLLEGTKAGRRKREILVEFDYRYLNPSTKPTPLGLR